MFWDHFGVFFIFGGREGEVGNFMITMILRNVFSTLLCETVAFVVVIITITTTNIR